MNFRQLEYILEVDRCGSINKASQTLFVSQPAISSAVHDLEAELGFPVFERSSKGITSTAEGKRFIMAARQIVDQWNQIRSSHTHGQTEPPLVLRISSGRYSFMSAAVIRFYEQELHKHSRFSLYINESGNADVVQDVFGRRADLGFIHVKNADEEAWKKRLEARNMEHIFLFRAYSCVTFRKSHPLAQRESFSRTDAVFLGITAHYVTEFHPDLVTIPIRGDGAAWNIYCVRLKGNPPHPYAARFIHVLQTLIHEKDKPLPF